MSKISFILSMERVNRLRFLVYHLGLATLVLTVFILNSLLLHLFKPPEDGMLMNIFVASILGTSVLCGILSIKFSIQRLHDFGMSGWMLLFWLIPGIQVLSFPFMCGIAGNSKENRYGPPPSDNLKNLSVNAVVFLILIATLVGIAFLIEWTTK